MAKSSLNLKSIILMGVGAVGMILAIVGMFVDFFQSKSGSLSAAVKLADVNSEAEMAGITIAFAWILFVLAIIAVAALIVSKFVDIKGFGTIVAIIGAVTILVTVLFVVFAIIFCSKNSTDGIIKVTTSFAAGPILMAIGGILAGGSAAVSLKL